MSVSTPNDPNRFQAFDRRRFLRGAGISVAGSALSSVVAIKGADAATSPAPTFQPDDWASVRSQFELDPNYLHFAAPVLASHPRPVRNAIERHRAGLDNNTIPYLHATEASAEAAIFKAATAYMGPASEGLALTDSTTMGLGILYGGVGVAPGDELLTTTHDFYSTHESLRLRAEQGGATVRKISLFARPERATTGEILTSVKRGIRDQTRVLAITWVHSSTGLKLPVREIADLVEEINAKRPHNDKVLLCLDAVHGFGVEAASPAELGADFFISGCHKWLFGPRGTGLIWGKGAAWSRTHATIPTFDPRGIVAWLEGHPPTDLPQGAAMTPGGFHSFEHRWALAEAFEFQSAIGKQRVEARTHELNTLLKQGLRSIDGITLITPMSEDMSAGLTVFDVAGRAPSDVVDTLEQEFRIVASVTPYAEPHVRLATSILNSEDEVDEVLIALKTLV
ncbi:MAG: aminotransferase class V-fold PLP-dependent enzyme [Actinomycetota bacterium]